MLSLLSLAVSARGQNTLADPVAKLLPNDARVIETADVIVPGKARTLVLWIKAPKRVAATWDSGPDFLYGDHWSGPANLSLVDLSTGALLNTVRIRPYWEVPDEPDSMPIPFLAAEGLGPYYVPNPGSDHRGKPVLLHLQDLTGEGVAGQFALFDYVASGISVGSVLGYSRKSDAAVQYPIDMTQNRFQPVVQPWTIQVFDQKPLRAGYWKFTWEPGHGSFDWVDEEVQFDPEGQLFVERKVTRPYPGFAQVHCDLATASLADFLGRMQTVALFGSESIQDVQGLVAKTPLNEIEGTGIVVKFGESSKSLDLEWQRSGAGKIGIEFMTASDYAAALQSELKAWCNVN